MCHLFLILYCMRLLELFSGTCSVSKVLKELHKDCEIVSLDIHQKFNATHNVDILLWDYTLYPPNHFDIIWASPPCTEYSKAKRVGVRNFALADAIVKRTIEIIEYYKPSHWYIENPSDGGLLKHRDFMKPLNIYMHTCCYCMYGCIYRKATNIWTNRQGLMLRMCNKHTTPCLSMQLYGKHIDHAQRSQSSHSNIGTSKTLTTLHSIPKSLLVELLNFK